MSDSVTDKEFERISKEYNSEGIGKFAAPWNLNGKGYIFIYKFPKKFVEEEGNVPEFLKGKFCGGLGAVMLVDYAKSDAGPYGEFLFIPGKFRFNRKRLNNISKIYVSSMESVVNGRANWAIPKEQADFTFTAAGKKTESVTVKTSSGTVAEFELKCGGIHFPVSTKLMPFPLVQKQNDFLFYTNFFGKGRGQLAKLKSVKINSELFPDISKFKPLAVVKVEPFDITFPKAVIEKVQF